MTKQAFKLKYDLTEAQYTGTEKVGGDLYLRSVTTLPDGFNPTVGGDLYLRSDLKAKAKWTKLTSRQSSLKWHR